MSWNGICFHPFVDGSGVKQGGVISPILFCIYIDSVHSRNLELAAILVICFLGLWPTPVTLCCSPLFSTCDNFADDLHIVFNTKKSKCIHIGPRLKLPYGLLEFYIGDMAVESVDKWPHLGHIICATRDDKADIMTPYVSILIMLNMDTPRLPN